jgi:hypothetical protein
VHALELRRRRGRLQADRDDELAVAWLHRGVEAEAAAQVDVAARVDRQRFEGDALERARRGVSGRQAGVERSEQQLLRTGELVRAAELARLVDLDRGPSRSASRRTPSR